MAAIAAIAVLLAGCTGNGSTGATGSVSSGTGSAATSASPTTPASPTATNAADRALQYARCLRSHGVQISDPLPGQPMPIPAGNKAVLTQALSACARYAGKSGSGMNAAQLDRNTRIAQCLRQNGIDAPDPGPGQPLVIHPHGNAARADQMMATCRARVGAASGGNQ